MKATGIVRKLDGLGRIVLPIELRRAYDMEPGTAIEVFTDDEGFILRKYKPSNRDESIAKLKEAIEQGESAKALELLEEVTK